MGIHLKRVSAFSAAVVTAGLLGVSSVAGASPMWGGYSHRGYDGSRRTTITNNNDIDISNRTNQSARSGDVRVSGNKFVGDVSSGNATNTNSSNFDVNVRNR